MSATRTLLSFAARAPMSDSENRSTNGQFRSGDTDTRMAAVGPMSGKPFMGSTVALEKAGALPD